MGRGSVAKVYGSSRQPRRRAAERDTGSVGYGGGGSALGPGAGIPDADSPLADAIAARLADSREYQGQDAGQSRRNGFGGDDESARLGEHHRACRPIQGASLYQQDSIPEWRHRADGFGASGDGLVRAGGGPLG